MKQREIKFRGKRKHGDEVLFGDLAQVDKVYIFPLRIKEPEYSQEYYEVIPETVGQFTGLKDKNGKEIYEGDILKRGDYSSFVVWGLDGWRYNSYMNSGMDLYPSVDRTRGHDFELAEIIGNMYESPERLQPTHLTQEEVNPLK